MSDNIDIQNAPHGAAIIFFFDDFEKAGEFGATIASLLTEEGIEEFDLEDLIARLREDFKSACLWKRRYDAGPDHWRS